MKQIIYPKYISSIFVTSVIFLACSVTIGKKLNDLFPPLDKKKSKNIIYLEVALQIGLIACLTHIFREYIGYFMKQAIQTEGNPDKFAALVVAPIIFSQQPELIAKIKYLNQ